MDDDLERMFRESLSQHADEVDTSIEVPTSKRSFPWQVPLVAAAVVGIVTAGAYLLADDEPPQSEPVPAYPVPADWRVESWHDIEVSVPSDWGWGGAPMRDHGRAGNSHLVCSEVLGGPGYVGRPIFQTDMCTTYDAEHPPRPDAPYLWLGASIDRGTLDLGAGWVQETIEVAGEKVTVASDDPALRGEILGSARVSSEDWCASEMDRFPRTSEESSGRVVGTSVCAYSSSDDGGRELVYATEIGAEATRDFLQAFEDEQGMNCVDSYPREWVVLHVHRDSAADQVFLAVTDDCTYVTGAGKVAILSPRTVAPWAVDGIPATVQGPSEGPWVYDYFIGPQG